MQIPDSSVPIERPCLYLVATPIGNLADVTLRALATLAACDLVLAEDTRMTRRLLDHYAIDKPLTAVHEHNERDIATRLVRRLVDDRLAAALVSDAGTPLISDPGYPLMQAALEAALPVRAVPGPSSVLAALCVSGLPSDRFAFEGFLPTKDQAARTALAARAQEERTLVFFEAPRRIKRTLALLQDTLGSTRRVAVARELTKLHEQVYRGEVAAVAAMIDDDAYGSTGEFVIVVAPAPPQPLGETQIRTMLTALAPHLPRSRAVEVTTSVLGCPRNEVYRIALSLTEAFADG
jgi:16S rRNA (cytidine1402-2'-O)-methyltransferase